MATPPLHTLDPTGRFSSRATAYALWRPDYPQAAIDLILDGLGAPDRLTVVDLGAGTGISSRMLADRGARVLAVEPNEAMRSGGGVDGQVEWIAAPAEETTLPDDCADAVTAFQAFHWFDPQRIFAEIHRLLKPGGVFAAIWNKRERRDPFTADYSELISRHARQHPAEERPGATDPLYSAPRFGPAELQIVPHSQRLPLAGLIGRAESTSYLPKEGPEQQALIADLTALHQRWADQEGMVRLVYGTEVYRLRAL
jgi:SAM-dependent methyltransferase